MIIQSVAGLFAFVAFAWLFSENRRTAQIQTVAMGLAIQLLLAVILLKAPFFKEFFLSLNLLAASLSEAATAGTSFVFGYLGGGSLPFDEKAEGSTFILAFRALPIVLLVSALSSLLFYWGVLPFIVRVFAWVLRKSMRLGGATGLGAAANIFVGMVEAPLFIRPYLKDMTRSEIFTLMTCGMATIAGTVMVLYATILSSAIPDAMGHILIASIISAPAAITVAAIMVPETREQTSGLILPPQRASSSMDAVTKGTTEGITLLFNITAMLVVMVALVSLMNMMLALLPDMAGEPVTLQRILGYVMVPVVWLMGVPWDEAFTAGSLMGIKTILNELLAYLSMAQLPDDALSPRSRMIMTYALCGFANFGSLGIMIGGMGAMVPERRDEIVSLGLKSIVAGTIATCMTGAVVGIIG